MLGESQTGAERVLWLYKIYIRAGEAKLLLLLFLVIVRLI